MILATAVCAFWRPARVAVRTALLVPDLFVTQPIRPQILFSHAPIVTPVEIPGRDLTAILYLPGGPPPHGCLVLTLGVHPVPPTDPSVQRLADGLARAGLAVLVIQSDQLVADRIDPAEVDNLVAAVEFARDHPAIDPERVGIFGFSAGASLAALTAADERVSDDVAVLGWLGGFADGLSVVRAIATSSFEPLEPTALREDPPGVAAAAPPEPSREWHADKLSRYIFVKQIVDDLTSPRDQEILRAIFPSATRESNDEPVLPPEPPVELTAEGRAVYDLLTTTDPAAVEQIIARLPARGVARLDALSPIRVANQIEAAVFLMHDRSDHLVPYAETVKLATALPASTPTRLYLFTIFQHVRPNRPVPVGTLLPEVARLYDACRGILDILLR